MGKVFAALGKNWMMGADAGRWEALVDKGVGVATWAFRPAGGTEELQVVRPCGESGRFNFSDIAMVRPK